MLLVRWLFRKSGAFFLRRSYADGSDILYATIFREYVQRILCDGQSLEFFIEGTRSRSGKMLHPKFGLLSIITGNHSHPYASHSNLIFIVSFCLC
jgi:glycerol-3-phosphate O-acyltransferase